MDAATLTAAFSKAFFGRILALNEFLALTHQGQQLLVRVTGTDSLPASEREDALGYHCFRGRLGPLTDVYLEQQRPQGGSATTPATMPCTEALQRGESSAQPSSSGSGSVQQRMSSLSLHDGGAGHQSVAAFSASGPPGPSGLEGGKGGHASSAESSHAVAHGGLLLWNVRLHAARPPRTFVVNVTTSDGEWFPVSKRLLRPCIALTKVGNPDV